MLIPGHLTPKISYVGRVNYELDGGQSPPCGKCDSAKYGLCSPEHVDHFQAGTIRFTPVIFSAQYNAERWSLTSEYALRHLKYRISVRFCPTWILPERATTSREPTVSHPEWEGIVRYDVLYTNRDDRDGKEFAAQIRGRPAHTRFAKDITAGLRWNITPGIHAARGISSCQWYCLAFDS